MLLSTLKRYVEAMGGKLDLVAKFPNRPMLIVEQIAEPRGQQKSFAKGPRTGKRHTAEVVCRCSFDLHRVEVRANPQVGQEIGPMRCISMPRTAATTLIGLSFWSRADIPRTRRVVRSCSISLPE